MARVFLLPCRVLVSDVNEARSHETKAEADRGQHSLIAVRRVCFVRLTRKALLGTLARSHSVRVHDSNVLIRGASLQSADA